MLASARKRSHTDVAALISNDRPLTRPGDDLFVALESWSKW